MQAGFWGNVEKSADYGNGVPNAVHDNNHSDEKEQKNESDFKEVIHSMNIEKHDNKNITIYIDLGTSPTSALIELIDILRTNGVIKVIFKNDGDL